MVGQAENSIEQAPRGHYWDTAADKHHAAAPISSTLINTYLNDGPHAAFEMLEHRLPRIETKAMRIGTTVHAAILESMRFAAEYVRRDWDARTKDGKARRAEVEAQGLVPVDPDEYDLAVAMRDAVYRATEERARDGESLLAELIHGDGRIEQSILWTHSAVPLQCKARLDKIQPGVVIDLKTAERWMPDDWARMAALRYGYHRQAAMYCDAYEAVHGACPRFLHVVVHKAPPHEVALYELGPQELELGAADVERALTEIAERMASGVWHHEAERGVRPVVFPAWVYAQQEARERGPELALTFGGEAVSL